ncbi:MAG: ABC transporter substrate-binding protein [Chloroflexi bacterium]|nr:ABC transporter substrate-binding protein [Chloroflexota bacterium]
MMTRRLTALLGAAVFVLAACGPAATATPVPTRQAPPTLAATAAPTSQIATPTTPPSAKPTATPAAKPTAAPTVAQAAGPKYGGTFKFATKATLPSWDGIAVTGGSVHNVVGFIYDRPQRYNPGPPACEFLPRAPSAVESWKWVNDTTFEMALRQGMRFHNKPPVNGREAVAEDLIFSIMKAGTKPGPSISDIPAVVNRAEAVDKYTVRLHLKQPYTVLPDRLPQDAAYLYAPEAVGEDLAITRAEEHIGTGPFVLKGDKPGVSVTLEKNASYWMKGFPFVDQFEFKMVPDVATRSAMFRTGQVDVAWREPIAVTEELTKVAGTTTQRCGDLPATTVTLTPDRPPFNDVRVRRAVSMAIDRDAVVKVVFRGNGDRLWVPIPHFAEPTYLQKEAYPPEVRKYLEYNPEEARKLLAEAGYAQGLTVNLNYTARYTNSAEIAEALNDQLGKVGINAKLRVWVDPAWSAEREAEKMPDIILSLTLGFPGSFQFVRAYHSTKGMGLKKHGIRDTQLDEWTEKLTMTRDPEEQKALQRQLQIRMVEQAYEPAVFADKPALILHPWVKNLYFQPLSLIQAVDVFWTVQVDR